jgi:hypothetical protein
MTILYVMAKINLDFTASISSSTKGKAKQMAIVLFKS